MQEKKNAFYYLYVSKNNVLMLVENMIPVRQIAKKFFTETTIGGGLTTIGVGLGSYFHSKATVQKAQIESDYNLKHTKMTHEHEIKMKQLDIEFEKTRNANLPKK
jgi:hypothetical protein